MADWNAAATSALRYWPDPADAATVVAIGMAESGLDEAARGDPLTLFSSSGQIPVAPDTYATYAQWSCGGYCSFGWLQVFLPVHHQKVPIVSTGNEACAKASWLQQWDNCTAIAHAIYADAGNSFTPWSTYKQGVHRQYLAQAMQAVAAVQQAAQQPVAPVATYSQDYLQMAAAAAMYRHYSFEVTGENIIGQLVLRLHEADGSISQPESYIAVQKPGS